MALFRITVTKKVRTNGIVLDLGLQIKNTRGLNRLMKI